MRFLVLSLIIWAPSTQAAPEVFRVFCQNKAPFDRHVVSARTDVVSDFRIQSFPLQTNDSLTILELKQILPLKANNSQASLLAVGRLNPNMPQSFQLGLFDINYPYKKATLKNSINIDLGSFNELPANINQEHSQIILVQKNSIDLLNPQTLNVIVSYNIEKLFPSMKVGMIQNPQILNSDLISFEFKKDGNSNIAVLNQQTKKLMFVPSAGKAQISSLTFASENNLAWIETNNNVMTISHGQIIAEKIVKRSEIYIVPSKAYVSNLAGGSSGISFVTEQKDNVGISVGILHRFKLTSQTEWIHESWAYPQNFLNQARKFPFLDSYISKVLTLPVENLIVLTSSIQGGFYTFDTKMNQFQERASTGNSPCVNPSWVNEDVQ